MGICTAARDQAGARGQMAAHHRADAEGHSLYGTGGIMVSLLFGMMLNVPIRAAEVSRCDAADPGRAAALVVVLHFAMTADVVLFSSLYMIAFVAALRRVPLFPRLLLAIWLGDLAMQLATAQIVACDEPSDRSRDGVADLCCSGNVKKVLISMALTGSLPTALDARERHLLRSHCRFSVLTVFLNLRYPQET